MRRIHSEVLVQAQQSAHRSLSRRRAASYDFPRGYFPVYVGRNEKRFVVPLSYLKHPLFQSLLQRAEEEFGFDQQTGVLRVPCEEDAFVHLTSQIPAEKK